MHFLEVGKYLKNFIFLLLIIIFLILSVKAYIYFSQTPEERFFYKKLNQSLKIGQQKIYVKGLTNFEWDKIYFVGSYNGFIDEEGNRCPSDDYDGAWSLAFTKKNKLIKCIKGKKYIFDRSLKSNSSFSINSFLVFDQHTFTIKEAKK